MKKATLRRKLAGALEESKRWEERYSDALDEIELHGQDLHEHARKVIQGKNQLLAERLTEIERLRVELADARMGDVLGCCARAFEELGRVAREASLANVDSTKGETS